MTEHQHDFDYPGLLVSDSGEIVACNSSFINLSGLSEEQILQQSITSLLNHSKLGGEKLHKNWYLYFDENPNGMIISDTGKHPVLIQTNRFKGNGQHLIQLIFKPTITAFRNQQELEQHIEFFKRIAEVIPDLAYIQKLNLKNESTEFLFVNSIVEEIFGFSQQEIRELEKKDNKAFFQYIHPEDRAEDLQVVIESLKGRKNFSRIFKMYTKNQEVKYLYANSSLFPINEYEVISFGVARDVTNLIQKQQKIELQKELFLSLADITSKFIKPLGIDFNEILELIKTGSNAIDSALLIRNKEETFFYHSETQKSQHKKIKKLLVEVFESIREKSFSKLFTNLDDLEVPNFNKLLKFGNFVISPIILKNKVEGILFSTFDDGILNAEIKSYYSQLSQIISFHLTESESLHQLDYQYHTFAHLLNNLNVGILVVSQETHQVLFSNHLADQMIQQSETIPSDHPLFLTIRNKHDKLYHDQRWYKILYSKMPWINETPADVYIILDITSNQELTEELQKSTMLLKTVVNNAPIGIVHIDPKGNILFLNDTFKKILDVSGEDVEKLKKKYGSVLNFPSVKRNKFDSLVQSVIENGKALEHTTWINLSSGIRKYLHFIFAPLKDNTGQVSSIIWVGQDMTQAEQLQEEKRRLQRLDSLGVLAASIAHDFNNLLTGIIGNLSLANTYLSNGKTDKLEKALTRAEFSAQKSKELTYKLLSFARGGIPDARVIDAKSLVKDISEILLAGSSIKLQFSCSAPQTYIKADPTQIEQVVSNLITNAAQAIGKSGSIGIDLQEVLLEENSSIPLEKGRYLKMEISDTGPGIPPDILPNIFDPFYSTKKKGSGLGLATSYKIIKNHNGLMTVNSTPGKGTSFVIYLPLTDETPQKDKTKPYKSPISTKKSGKILVLDDEEYIRKIIYEMLTNQHFEVIAVERGEKAIEVYKDALEHNEPFDLVLLDLTIRGGLGGLETFEQIKEMDPNVKALLATGYADEGAIKKFEELGFKYVLQKPFAYDYLIQKIAEHL